MNSTFRARASWAVNRQLLHHMVNDASLSYLHYGTGTRVYFFLERVRRTLSKYLYAIDAVMTAAPAKDAVNTV